VVFEWLSGGKVDHPMADIREARKIVAALPADDASLALGEITRWLESLKAAEGYKLNRRLENLDLLDGASGKHHRKLLYDYLATPRHKKSEEHRLWTDVYRFWRELGEGYLKCIQHYEASPGRAGDFKESLPIVVARALRALRQQLKWVLLRYGLVEERIWSDLAHLYQFAESKGFTEEVVAVHPGTIGASTVKQEFLKALVLAASSTDSLHPVAQDLASRLVTHFSKAFVMARKTDSGCTHWFDLAEPKAPVRIVGQVKDKSAVRFFGAGLAVYELEQLKAHIAYTRNLPDDLELPGEQDIDALTGLLTHLELNWSGKTQSRRFERRKVAARVTVVPGIRNIVEVLEFAVNDSLDFSHQQAAESWIVEDLSEGGYGAVIPSIAGDWVEVGSIIGVEGESFRQWRVGLIRRVTRNEQQQQRVGVQLLTHDAALVSLAPAATAPRADAAAPRLGFGVLLAPTPEGREEIELVTGKDVLDGSDSVEISVGDKPYHLVNGVMVDHGSDYDRFKFKLKRWGR